MAWIVLILKTLGDAILEWLIGKSLDERFPWLFKNNLKIIEEYEKRIKGKDVHIKKLKERRERGEEKHKKEKARIIASLKRRGLSTDKLIEKYDKPLNAILISYSSQKTEVRKGSFQGSHFIKEELKRYNAKYLGGTESLIPPARVPSWIKDGKDLRRWFKRNILRKKYCKLKLLILIDLKKKAFWDNYLPYSQKHPIHRTIGEVLTVEDLFTEQQINRIALSEIIIEGDIAWLTSTILAGEELQKILNNQGLIEKKLGHPPLRKLANDSVRTELTHVLSEFVSNPREVSQAIIEEAKFWNERLKG